MTKKILDYDVKDCASEIKKFLNIIFPNLETSEQLDLFKNWSFEGLSHWDSFYPYGMLHKSDDFDPDATVLANMIYLVCYHDKLPDLNTLNDIDGEKYRGETINTFNNLFQDKLEGVKEWVPLNEENQEFYNKVRQFRDKYLTLGNFMLLPNGGGMNSLNMQKQRLCKDYADIFYSKLFGNNSELEKIKNLELNKNYFEKINDFKTFCEKNFLEEYIENGKPKNVFFVQADISKPYVWYKNKAPYMNEVSTEKYKDFALNYMRKATEIIESRAKEICEILKERIK
ncbi:MAG: hypothetical protein K6E29_01255 [Cyanobacteria bacterium RUI128]|nr:hypothetical protein [Cyanobacteria bacterium RUI128]